MLTRIGSWLGIFVAITLMSSRVSGQTMLLTPPAQSVSAGSSAELTVYFLNRSDLALILSPPDTFQAELRWTEGASAITLARVEPAAEHNLRPGAFLPVWYRFTVPEKSSGQVIISIKDSPSAVMEVVSLQERPAAATQSSLSSTTIAAESKDPRDSEVVDYIAKHFSAYEPMYFLIGSSEPRAKFQLSLKYRILNEDASVAKAAPWLNGLHFAYSQTSFWDLESSSSPFFDNSYRPELMLSYADLLPRDGAGALRNLGLQTGLQHESNGQDGADSRSMNFIYVRPTFTFAAPGDDLKSDSFFVSVSPRIHAYLGDDGDNPDIEEFRGYGDLRVVVGQRGGLQLAAIGRIGSHWDKGSLQLDLTYPLRPLLRDNLDIYLHGQLFTGYGESLLLYNESDTTFRVGVSLLR